MATSREPVGPYNDGYTSRTQPPYVAPPQPGGYPANPHGNYNPQNPQVNPMNFKLSPDEMRVLQECNKESFYQRCLPLMSTFGLGTYYAIKSGFINGGTPPFGHVGKVGLAVVAGFLLGKISYIGKCESKILTLPDSSQLKQSILKKKISGSGVADTLRDSLTMDPTFGQSISPFGGGDGYSNQAQTSALDMDTSRPMDTFDAFHSKQDNPEEELILPARTSPGSVTYEELRRRNREGYDSSRQPYRSPSYDQPIYPGSVQQPPTYSAPIQQPASYSGPAQQPAPYSDSVEQLPPLMGETSPTTSSRPSFRYQVDGRKNQYGDVWDK